MQGKFNTHDRLSIFLREVHFLRQQTSPCVLTFTRGFYFIHDVVRGAVNDLSLVSRLLFDDVVADNANVEGRGDVEGDPVLSSFSIHSALDCDGQLVKVEVGVFKVFFPASQGL